MSVIYIAGPITDRNDYHLFFNRAADNFTALGNIVFNPATMPIGLPHDAYMPICYAMMDACDTVYFMHGWGKSKGAVLEYNYAIAKGMKLMFEEGESDG